MALHSTSFVNVPLEQLSAVQASEWGRPVLTLVHTPNDGGELIVPALHAPSALFESAFDPDLAAADHRNFIEVLKSIGSKVITVREALLANTEKEGDALTRLRRLAIQSVTLDSTAFPEDKRLAEETRVRDSILAYSPLQLFRVVMLRPVITLSPTNTNTGYSAKYTVFPLKNMCFLRDQSITTAAGRILGRPQSRQREAETVVMDAVLDAIGQRPILKIREPGVLEGGDFIPARDVAIIAVGLRTNFEAVKQIMAADAFGATHVIVVRDNWRSQEETHLDSYFNLINSSLAVMVDTRVEAREGDVMYTTCDVYKRRADVPTTLRPVTSPSVKLHADPGKPSEVFLDGPLGVPKTAEAAPTATPSSSGRTSSEPTSPSEIGLPHRGPVGALGPATGAILDGDFVGAAAATQAAHRRVSPNSHDSGARLGPATAAAASPPSLVGDGHLAVYEPIITGANFPDILRQFGFKIIPISNSDRELCGTSFLTVSPYELLLVRAGHGVSQALRHALKTNGISFKELEMSALTKGYGSAHASVQVTRM